MTWQTCLRFVTRRRVPVLATTPDRAETPRQGGPMHDRTCLEVLQLLLCKFTTMARLPLDSFVPRESTVRSSQPANDRIGSYACFSYWLVYEPIARAVCSNSAAQPWR